MSEPPKREDDYPDEAIEPGFQAIKARRVPLPSGYRQGVISAISQTKFAMSLAKHGKVPLPIPPHVAEGVKEARALYNLVKEQGKDGAEGIVQVEKGLAHIEFAKEGEMHLLEDAAPELPDAEGGD